MLVMAAAAMPVLAQGGEFVEVTSVRNCPALPPRLQPPKSVFDLRIDDIKTIMGVGTSAMAAFGAKSTTFSIPLVIINNPLWEDRFVPNALGHFSECVNRGVNFATGGDQDSTSVGALLRNFNPRLRGLSAGRRSFAFCFGKICPSRVLFPDDVEVQGLNAAQSGAWMINWPNQMGYFRDWLPKVDPDYLKSDDYKLLIVELGVNDACQSCAKQEGRDEHTADLYEKHLRDLLDSIKKNVKNVVVLVMSLINFEAFYKLQRSLDYCDTA
ncbi:hypothetical protein HDU67_004421, partial [Dinochytrium kinnereticum]